MNPWFTDCKVDAQTAARLHQLMANGAYSLYQGKAIQEYGFYGNGQSRFHLMRHWFLYGKQRF